MYSKIAQLLSLTFLLTSQIFGQLNWQQTNGPFGGIINDISKDSKGNYYAASDAGLFMSNDNCEHWNKVNIPGFANDGMSEIFMHPSGRMFISGWNSNLYISDPNISTWEVTPLKRQINIDSHGNLYGVNQNSIFVSSDIGKSWNKLADFNHYISYFCMVNDSDLVVAADTIYYSDDKGKTWHKSDVAFNWDSGFIIDANKNIYFIAEWNIYKSNDNGKSWKVIKDHMAAADPNHQYYYIYRVFVDKNNVIYTCTNKDLISSSDGGATWSVIGSVSYPLKKFWQDDLNNIYCLGGEAGIYLFDPVKSTMVKKSYGILAHNIRQIIVWKGNLICAAEGFHFITYDSGDTWQKFNIPSYGEILFINSNDRIFAEGSYKLLYSDDGIDWKEINFPDKFALDYGVMAEDNNIILLFDSHSNLYRSADLGNSWNIVWRPQSAGGTRSICICSQNEFYFAYGIALYKSTDQGATWNCVHEFSEPILTISKSPWGNIFIGTENGVYKNNINGWEKIDSYYNHGYVKKIIYTGSNRMYTLGNGLYVSDDFGKSLAHIKIDSDHFVWPDYINIATANDETIYLSQGNYILISTDKSTKQSLPNSTYLLNNYPNPFNNQTTIEFYLSEPGETTLSIFDVTGRLVDTIFKRNIDAGFYKINWQPQDFSSGIYFYSLSNGKSNQAKKMILLK